MSKGGYVPFDKTNPVSKEKKWIPSEELKKKLYNLKQMGNKKGEIQVSSGYVNMLNDSGVKTQLPDWCPQHYKEGSFSK
jgi:hypothetical protein